MAGFTYSTLTTAIQNYTEVGTSVLSSTITDQFIDNSELRINRLIYKSCKTYFSKPKLQIALFTDQTKDLMFTRA